MPLFARYKRAGEAQARNQARKSKQKAFKKQQLGLDRKTQNEKTVNSRINQAKTERQTGFNEGVSGGEEFWKRDIQGLDPKKRTAMQNMANQGIRRNYNAMSKKLIGDQATRNVIGKGGVAYQQQRDLDRLAREDEGKVENDLNVLDSDLALKNKAAIYAHAMGSSALPGLDRQYAEDEVKAAHDEKRARKTEKKLANSYSMVRA